MPEGPEVRREADQIGEVLINRRLTEVFFGPTPLKRHRKVTFECNRSERDDKRQGPADFF